MFRLNGLWKAGIAAVAMAGAVATMSLPAEAGRRTGTWANGMVMGPYGPGYYGPGGAYYGGGHGGHWGHGGYRRAFIDESDCYTVRRRVVDDWGRVYVRRTRVCD